jgi:hypothetical protein
MWHYIALGLMAAGISLVVWGTFIFLMTPALMGDEAPEFAKRVWRIFQRNTAPPPISFLHVDVDSVLMASAVEISKVTIIDFSRRTGVYLDTSPRVANNAATNGAIIDIKDWVKISEAVA